MTVMVAECPHCAGREVVKSRRGSTLADERYECLRCRWEFTGEDVIWTEDDE